MSEKCSALAIMARNVLMVSVTPTENTLDFQRLGHTVQIAVRPTLQIAQSLKSPRATVKALFPSFEGISLRRTAHVCRRERSRSKGARRLPFSIPGQSSHGKLILPSLVNLCEYRIAIGFGLRQSKAP